MDSTSLKKPVNLQGLSLALAKTKADYENRIANSTGQSNWEEEDDISPAHVLNRPAIRAGEGDGSIIEGKIEPDENATIYTLIINGDANATVYTYTTEDTLPSSNTIDTYVYYDSASTTQYKYAKITDIDTTNNVITLSNTLSTSAISNAIILLYYRAKNIAIGAYAHAEGRYTVATNVAAHAEGYGTFARSTYSHAEGQNTKAVNGVAHAEGGATIASGVYSHAEGLHSIANRIASHAEGNYTTASGNSSHAEGNYTTASGNSSHAEGNYTIAASEFQHVQGKYNIEDSANTYADIVGNGTSSSRSNAYTLDWSGNGWYAGKVSAGTVESPANPTAANDLATKAYVDSATAGITTNLAGLTDTTITTPTDGQVLTYDSTTSKWVNSNADSGVMVINVTDTEENGETVYTADKTFAEVYAHVSNGGYAHLNRYDTIYILSNYDEYSICFLSPVSIDGDDYAINEGSFYLLSDNTINFQEYDLDCMPNHYYLSMTNNVITITGSHGDTSSITLPVYGGNVTEVWSGGAY